VSIVKITDKFDSETSQGEVDTLILSINVHNLRALLTLLSSASAIPTASVAKTAPIATFIIWSSRSRNGNRLLNNWVFSFRWTSKGTRARCARLALWLGVT
jgi:hypothetical protein